MAVAFDARMTGGNGTGGNSQQATAQSATISSTGMTVGVGATDLVGIVMWGKAGSGQPATRTMTWNGTSMTERAVFGVGNGTDADQVSIFVLSSPVSGNKTLVANWTGSTDDVYMSAISFTGSNGINVTNTVQQSGTTATIASATGNMTVAAMVGNGGSPTTNFNQIFVNSPFAPGGGASYQAGSASNAHTFTGSGATIFAVVGIDIVAAAGGGVTVALTNAAATFSAGSITPSTAKALTNALATFSAGTITAAPSIGLTNAAATWSAGSLTPSTAKALTNALATFSAGTLTPGTSVSLTNALATWGAGTISVSGSGDVTVALTNAAATWAAGNLTPSTTVALSNGLATWSAGSIVATPTVGLSNAAAIFSAGNVTPALSVPLTNALATFSAGNVGIGGDVTIALTSASATWSAGIVTAQSPLPPAYDPGDDPGFNLKEWKKRRKPQQELEDDIEALYLELIGSPERKKAAAIVKPFAESRKAVPPPETVNWAEVTERLVLIEKLEALRQVMIAEADDDDDEDFLLL